MLKRILAGLLCCCLVSVVTGTVSAESNESQSSTLEGYDLAAENKSMALFYKTAMASIAVMDKSNGKCWYSELPQDQIPADGVTNIISSEFQSLLTISYTLINKVTSTKTTSPLQSLSPEVTPKVIADGIAYEITIDTIHLVFEVDIVLDGKSIEVSIPDDKIQEGAGVEKQLETKINSIVSFIDKTTEFTENLLDATDYPGGFRSDLKSCLKKLASLKEIVQGISDAVGIETVSDDILSEVNDIQSLLEGSASDPGFFSNIATSSKISDDVKKKYSSLQKELDDTMMPVKITISALKIINVGSLVEVEVLPYFGACGDSVDGYMLYPNGCGAITEFKEKHGEYSSNYKTAVYSDTEPDIDWEQTMDSAGLKRTAIPYFGVKQEENGFIAYVTSGKSESNINFSPSGYIINVNRICSSFQYRRTVAVASSGGQWEAGQIPTAYEEERNAVNACVRYMFLNGGNANYSGMACTLSAYMAEQGTLQKNPILSQGVPLALEFLGGYNQKVLVFDNYITGTTFSKAQTILEEITGGNSLPLLINYKGYRKGGYGVYPADDEVAGQLGGISGLQALAGYIKSLNGYLFLEDNLIEAQIGQSGYTEGNLALSSYYRVIQSEDNSTYLLSPSIVEQRVVSTELPFYQSTGAFGVTQDRIGSFIYFDYSDKHKALRSDTTAIWESILKQTKEEVGGLAVNGGNEYTFPYADWIKNVPTSTTGYLYTDYDVPFYQMLIHGYIPYTSEAINQYYDKDYQFLKMVEYGNLPFYTLAAEDIDTNEAGTYVSQYGVYYEDIVDTYNRYAQDLAGIIDQQMISHTINGDLVTVEYANGTKVFINYSGETITAEGYTVPSMDYIITDSEGGISLEKVGETAVQQGEQGGLSFYNSLDYRFFIVLFVSAVLFAGIGVFFYKKRRHI